MDERKDRNITISAPQNGDLVKIKKDYCHPLWLSHHLHPIYGIVVNSDLMDNKPTGIWVQTKMFPEVSVYVLKTGQIVPLLVAGVEIISNCIARS